MPAADTPVSVIVPAWNAARTLGETLESVASQTHRQLEILIVDDGSSDATAAIAEQFCEKDDRARLIRKANGGVASARNAAIDQASGDWLAPLDADDLWHPTKIERQLEAALAAPEPPGFVYCWYRMIDEHGRVLGSGPRLEFNGRAFTRIAYRNPVENGSSLLLSRSAVLGIGGYDASLRDRGAQGCEDVMIQLQIARAHPIAAVPEYLVGYRVRPGAMSADNDQILRSWRLVYDRIRAEAELPRELLRWHDADVHMTLAESSARERGRAEVVRNLLKALRGDPVRSSAYLLYRGARAIMRGMGSRGVGPGPDFFSVDPREIIRSDDNPRIIAELLRSIDSRRLRRLSD